MEAMARERDTSQEILNALSEDWLGRDEIAQKWGKKRLNPSEIDYLRELVESGQVERKTETVGITPKYYYRKAQ